MIEYKSKYNKYKKKYIDLKYNLIGGNKQFFIKFKDMIFTYNYNNDTKIKDLIDFINFTNKKLDKKIDINYVGYEVIYYNKVIIIDKSNKEEYINKYIKEQDTITIKKPIDDKFDGKQGESAENFKTRKIFTDLLIYLNLIQTKENKYDRIIISEYSCNIVYDISSIEKNILQQFQQNAFKINDNNIIIILYDKLFFKLNNGIQFFDLIENIREEKDDIIKLDTDKFKKFIYNGSIDQEFYAKNQNEYNIKYINQLNKTHMKNKNIIFYVINHNIINTDDYPEEIIKKFEIENINIYKFDGSK